MIEPINVNKVEIESTDSKVVYAVYDLDTNELIGYDEINIIPETPIDTQQLAEALSALPEETLNALKNALGL